MAAGVGRHAPPDFCLTLAAETPCAAPLQTGLACDEACQDDRSNCRFLYIKIHSSPAQARNLQQKTSFIELQMTVPITS